VRRFVIAVRVTVSHVPELLPGLRLATGSGQAEWAGAVGCLPGRSGKVGGDDVGRVLVEAAAGAVISHGGPGIGVRGGFLHVPERDAGVEGGRDERVPQGMRPDRLGDPGAAGHPADNPGGAVPVQPLSVRAEENRPAHALADGQVDRPGRARCQRDGDDLAALARDDQRAVPALDAQVLDVSAGGLGDPQPVERQQRDQRVLARRSEPSGNKQLPEFVAVQPGGVRLVVQTGSADMDGR
jgi:hypothetical protein